MRYVNVKSYYILIIFLLLTQILHTQNAIAPFDVSEIIEQVTHNTRFMESRDREFLIDTSVVYGPALSQQELCSVAFDGTNYLVVWEDYRIGSSYSMISLCDIYGCRVDQSGIVLDSAGIVISSAPARQYSPSVAFDGENYLVVWADERNGTWDIYGTRVAQSGMILDSSGIAISIAPSNQWGPGIGFCDSIFLVTWVDNRFGQNDNSVFGSRVNRSGMVLDTAGIAVAVASRHQYSATITSGDSCFMVVWSDERNGISDVYGARVSQSGIVLDSIGIPISARSSYEGSPSIAFDGSNFLAVWEDSRNYPYDIYGARIDQSGTLIDTNGILVATGDDSYYCPAIAFDDTNYLVVWYDYTGFDIYGARMNPSAVVLDTNPIPIAIASGDQRYASLCFGNLNYFVVWSDGRVSDYEIFGSRVNRTGTVLDPNGIDISIAANDQWSPSLAFDNTIFLVTWYDYRKSYPDADIFGMRLDQSGTVLDPEPIKISNAQGRQWYPVVAACDTVFLVAWEDYRNGFYPDIYAARVTQSGTVLDTAGIPLSTLSYYEASPALARDSVNYFAIWEDASHNGYYNIYGARVNQSGVVLDTNAIAISISLADQHDASVAFDGTNYLAVWQDSRDYNNIHGARVNQSGIVLDTNSFIISNAQNNQGAPAVAFDGLNYFIVWEDNRNHIYDADIYGARVSQSGVLLDSNGIAISTASDKQLNPTIAYDGTNYLVLWQNKRNGSFYDIYAAKLNPAGAILDTFVVSSQSGNQISPTVMHGQGETMVVTYSGWTDAVNNHPANTMRIWGMFYPRVGVEEDMTFNEQITTLDMHIYPNPIEKECNIKYFLPYETKVKMSLYDVAGRLVHKVINKNQKAGVYLQKFDMVYLPQGVYFIRLETASYVEVKKVILTK